MALTEDIIDHHGYAVPRDMVSTGRLAGPAPTTRPPPPPPPQNEYAQPVGDGSEGLGSQVRARQQRKGPRERREQIALQQGMLNIKRHLDY